MAESTPPSSPPRAFAQGVGILLQTVGVLMFLTSCCVCSGRWFVDPPLSPADVSRMLSENPEAQEGQAAWSADSRKAGMMLLTMFSTVGGLTLAVFGLGLQSDKPRAAWGALISSAALSVVLIVAGALLIRGGATVAAMIWLGLLLALTLALTGFCFAALRQVRANPPPRQVQTFTADEIERMKPRSHG